MDMSSLSIRHLLVFFALEFALAAVVIWLGKSWWVFAIASLVLFALLWIYDRRNRMEPWHLIAVGLGGVLLFASIALGGVIWQYKSAPQAATPLTNSSQTGMTIDGLDTLVPTNPAAQTNRPIVPKPFLSNTDKEQISAALLEISQVNNSKVNKLFWDAEKLYVPWANLVSQIDVEFAKNSLKETRRIRADLDSAQNEMYDTVAKKYEYYADDLKDVLLYGKTDGIHPVNKLGLALDDFANALINFIELAGKYQIGREDAQKLAKLVYATSQEVRNGVGETVGWSEFMKDRIKKKKESLSQ